MTAERPAEAPQEGVLSEHVRTQIAASTSPRDLVSIKNEAGEAVTMLLPLMEALETALELTFQECAKQSALVIDTATEFCLNQALANVARFLTTSLAKPGVQEASAGIRGNAVKVLRATEEALEILKPKIHNTIMNRKNR